MLVVLSTKFIGLMSCLAHHKCGLEIVLKLPHKGHPFYLWQYNLGPNRIKAKRQKWKCFLLAKAHQAHHYYFRPIYSSSTSFLNEIRAKLSLASFHILLIFLFSSFSFLPQAVQSRILACFVNAHFIFSFSSFC